MKKCFDKAQILLPKPSIDLEKWAVVACDQFTSQPEYWEKAEAIVGDAPSTLRMVLPEVYLAESDARVPVIQKTMKDYLDAGIFREACPESLILVERITESGVRLGLVGQIDLEQYDFSNGSQSLIRATEQTVISRIPPRVKVRQDAILEAPHVMLLFDDPKCEIIEPLYERVKTTTPVYDFELMLGGGTIKGYELTGADADAVVDQFVAMEKTSGGLLFAVGDGNHSLATAKTCWENIKGSLSEEAQKNHPARYALVELVNLHSDSMQFEPIHRVLFNVKLDDFMTYFNEELEKQGLKMGPGEEIILYQGEQRISISIENKQDRLPIEILQKIIDAYLLLHSEGEVDYIHGEQDLEDVAKAHGGCGILLQTIDKSTLFPAIRAGGVLPRKTFSIGHAHEKRYYLESRKFL